MVNSHAMEARPKIQSMLDQWNALDPKLKQSLSPALLTLGAAAMIPNAPTKAIGLGGAALAGLGLNVLGLVNGGERYQDILKQFGITDPRLLNGVLGLAASGLLGIPAAQDVLKNGLVVDGKLNTKALIAFANLVPWLITNGLDFSDGLVTQQAVEKVGQAAEGETPAVSSIKPEAHAGLGLIGGTCVLLYGLANGLVSTTFTGGAFVASDLIRLLQGGATVQKSLTGMGEAGQNFMNLFQHLVSLGSPQAQGAARG